MAFAAESAGTGPVVLQVIPVSGGASSGITMDHFLYASLFPHPLLVQWTCAMHEVSEATVYCYVIQKCESLEVFFVNM